MEDTEAVVACAAIFVCLAYAFPGYSAFVTRTVAGRILSLSALFVMTQAHFLWGLIGFVTWLLLWSIGKKYVPSDTHDATFVETEFVIEQQKRWSEALEIEVINRSK
jgi:hypothetical protein